MYTRKNSTHAFVVELFNRIIKNSTIIITGLAFIIVCVTLFFFYTQYVSWQERSAQRDFEPLIIKYNKMIHQSDSAKASSFAKATEDRSRDRQGERANTDESLSNLLVQFEELYKKHSRAASLPYYKEYKAHILLQENKKDEALACLNEIVAAVTPSSLSPLLQAEHALLLLDNADENCRKAGEEILKKLSSDKMNQFNDFAQFYLGLYYWSKDNVAQARDTWQQLVDEQHDEKMAPSPWAEQAKEYLKVVIV